MKKSKIPVFIPMFFGVLSIPLIVLWLCCQEKLDLQMEPLVVLWMGIGSILTSFSAVLWNKNIEHTAYKENRAKTFSNKKRAQLRAILKNYLEDQYQNALDMQFSLLQKLECDRDHIVNIFERHYRGKGNQYPQHPNRFFIVHGYDSQKPNSLIETICIKHERRNKRKVKWPLEPSVEYGERMQFFDLPLTEDLADSQFKLQEESLPKIMESGKVIKQLSDYHACRYAKRGYRIIPFKIESRNWKTFTCDFLAWMVETFCPVIDYHPAKLIFFLSIDWGGQKTTGKLKKQQKEILEELKNLNDQFETIVLIEEPVPEVKVADVKNSLNCLNDDGLFANIIHTMLSNNERDLEQALLKTECDKELPLNMNVVEPLLMEISQCLEPKEVVERI